jgi:hypothetical protein
VKSHDDKNVVGRKPLPTLQLRMLHRNDKIFCHADGFAAMHDLQLRMLHRNG